MVIAFAGVGGLLGSGIEQVFRMLEIAAPTSNDILTQRGLASNVALFGSISVTPVVEELVFRGVVLSRLERFGGLFAIVTTSALFGLLHQDFSQGMAAFFMGLAFGWVANRYSVVWSMVMHAFNNVVLAYGGEWLDMQIGERNCTIVQLVCMVAAIAIVCTVLLCNRKSVKAYFTSSKSVEVHPYRSWIAPVFLIFALLSLVTAVIKLFVL